MNKLPMIPQDMPPAPDPTNDTDGLVSDPARTAELSPAIQAALKKVYDPEIPVDIWNLGLIYGVTVTPEHDVEIKMTLTAPACPAAEMLPPEVEQKAAAVPGVRSAKVEIVWEPPWDKDMMSEAAKLQLGFF